MRLKYGNKWTACLSKHRHQSKLEADLCNRLMSMKQKKEIKSYDIQCSFDLFGPDGQLICKHIVDFMVVMPDGRIEIVEAKGVKTSVWRIKHKLFKSCYPEFLYRIVERR